MAELRSAVVDAYRATVAARYADENLARFERAEGIPDDVVDRLRSFFLEQMYPPATERAELDGAFEGVRRMIRSPGKLLPLLGAALRSMFTFGRRLPAALASGRRTLEAYLASVRLEQDMAELAAARHLRPADLADPARFGALVAALPRDEVIRLRYQLMRLLHELADTELLRSAITVFEQTLVQMRERPERFDDADRAGLKMATEVLTAGTRLFESLEPALLADILRGIEEVEVDWYEGICAAAGV